MEPSLVRELLALDGKRLALHLETRGEFERAFPLFFRAVGQEACRRLWERFPDAAAFVGEDCRREAAARYPHLARLPLDWVAFAFRGLVMWDLHIGVVADLGAGPPTIQVGIHTTPALWPRLHPVLRAVAWEALVGQKLAVTEASVVGEIQLSEPARPLALSDLGGEVPRLAERAAGYYEIVAPLLPRAGLLPRR